MSYLGDGKTFFALDVLAYRGAVGLGAPMRGFALVESTDGGAALGGAHHAVHLARRRPLTCARLPC